MYILESSQKEGDVEVLDRALEKFRMTNWTTSVCVDLQKEKKKPHKAGESRTRKAGHTVLFLTLTSRKWVK